MPPLLARRLRLPLAALVAASASLGASVQDARCADLDEGVRFKSVGLQGNPLGFVIGRYSADLEFLPLPHHALHLTPIGYYALPGTDDQLTGFGAEVGYRWYSGTHGPHGIFVGASFLAGEYEYIHGAPFALPLDRPDDTQYASLGGAIDAGYQVIALGNLSVGLGVGAQYTIDTTQPHFEYASHPWHDFIYGWGLRPRVLVAVGAAF